MKSRFSFIVLLAFIQLNGIGQSTNFQPKGINRIHDLINNNHLDSARFELHEQIESFKSENNFDTLSYYVQLVGSLKLAHNNAELALQRAIDLIEDLKKHKSPILDKNALMELSWVQLNYGKYDLAIETTQQALDIANSENDVLKFRTDKIYYNLGKIYHDLGNTSKAEDYFQQALKINKTLDIRDFKMQYQLANALGGTKWQFQQLDSAQYFYNEAIEALDQLDDSPESRLYRPSIVRINIALVEQNSGLTKQALQTSNKALYDLKKFNQIVTDETMKLRSIKNQIIVIRNMVSFYNQIGEYNQSNKLCQYVIQLSNEHLQPSDPSLTISYIALAQSQLAMNEWQNSIDNFNEVITKIKNLAVDQDYWRAVALAGKAKAYYELGNTEMVLPLMEESEELFRQSLQGIYQTDFLNELIHFSQFYADLNLPTKAISLAEEAHHYIRGSTLTNSIQDYYFTINLAEVHFKLNQPEQAYKFSSQALSYSKYQPLNTNNKVDSIQFHFISPNAMFIRSKSLYDLKNSRTIEFLEEQLKEMEDAISILDQRKTTINNAVDLNALINENNEVFQYTKLLRLELYKKTNNPDYLYKLLSLHESSIYQRIRSRIQLKTELKFFDIPEILHQRENYLRQALHSSLESNGNIEMFNLNLVNWNKFLDTLKKDYPKYYKFKYATIEHPFSNIQSDLKENTTVIRYLFINRQLTAFVITKDNFEFFELQTNDLDQLIDVSKSSGNSILYQLYKQLWQPIEPSVRHRKIIVIPDGVLFNLSFESLLSKADSTKTAFENHSLLSRYQISYNYSLFLTRPEPNLKFENNFVAFAPEFSDEMKEEYILALSNTLDIDKTYLTLLPQSRSADLADTYAKRFHGKAFLNDRSTKHIFAKEASEHKIIHIGTHAESNNTNPELSRLIFAKDLMNNSDNSLYTQEIYNYNLSSNLTLLTACETGKPTYQPGEGMISLAHAFNYAGSESMITSLWKIDEKSSEEIISSFYKNLHKGNDKDEALRKAKLNFISNATSITINQQYWAGLVLIGNSSPIEFSSSFPKWIWILLALPIITILIFGFQRKANIRHQ